MSADNWIKVQKIDDEIVKFYEKPTLKITSDLNDVTYCHATKVESDDSSSQKISDQVASIVPSQGEIIQSEFN